MGGLYIEIAGIDCSSMTLRGWSISETLAQAATCSLVIDDLNGLLPVQIEPLADVTLRVVGDTNNLFRGQLTSDRVVGIRPGVRHTIGAEGYHRLLAKSIVAPLSETTRTVTSDNDVSIVNENPYVTDEGSAVSLVSEADIIRDLLDLYWEGPALDYSGIHEYGPKPDPPMRFSNVALGEVIITVATRFLDTATFWIDADLVAHLQVMFVGSAGEGI
jgi:hypothetical protein